MTFRQFYYYYNAEFSGLTAVGKKRLRAEYEQTMAEVDGDKEARAWLRAYGAARGADVPIADRTKCTQGNEEAGTVPACGPPEEARAVEDALLKLDEEDIRGTDIAELLDERWDGSVRPQTGRRQRKFLTHWRGHSRREWTWETADTLLKGGRGNKRERQRAITAATQRLRGTRTEDRHNGDVGALRRQLENKYGVKLQAELLEVLPFTLHEALKHEFAGDNGGWAALRDSEDMSVETQRLRRAAVAVELHAFRAAMPRVPRAADRQERARARWPAEAWAGQTMYGGGVQGAACVVRGDGTEDPAAWTPATGGGSEATERCLNEAMADGFMRCLHVEGIDGLADASDGDRREGAGTGTAAGQGWPRCPGPGKVVPGLYSSGAREDRRTAGVAAEGRARWWVQALQSCIAPTERGVWQWETDHEDPRCHDVQRKASADVIVQLFSRWPEAETAWARGSRAARRVLYRGVRDDEVPGKVGVALPHDGTDAQHAEDIATGSKGPTRGVSYTKEPMVALAYAAGGTGKVACFDTANIGRFTDYSTAEGAERLLQAAPEGVGRTAAVYARKDAEVRGDARPTARAEVGARFEGKRFNVQKEKGQSKTAWRQAAGEATVGPMVDHAARCEGWTTGAPRAQTGEEETVSLRMDWEEAAGLHEETSAAMARMALQIHAEHDFTHACATDGGLAIGPNGEDDDQTGEQATAYGLVAYSAAGRTTLGRRLPAGSTVQDAELLAILECVRWAAAPGNGAPRIGDRRLYILSDSKTQLLEAEKAYRSASAIQLRTSNRRGGLEELTWRRMALGAVIMQFVRSHEGVYPNAHADMVATAALRGTEREPRPFRIEGELEYEIATETNGGFAAAPADRTPRDLLLTRSQDYVARRLRGDEDTWRAEGWQAPAARPGRKWLLDWDRIATGKSGLWTAVVRRAGAGGHGRGGPGRASDAGAVMMARSEKHELPGEYDEERRCPLCNGRAMTLRHALRCRWRGEAADDERDKERSALRRCLEALTGAVGEAKDGPFHDVVDAAKRAVAQLGQGRDATDAEWESLLRAAGGMLPEPSGAEWRATEDIRATAEPAGDTEDWEASTRGQAVKAAVEAVRCTARALADTAAAWYGEWRGKEEECGDGRARWAAELYEDEVDATEVDMQHVGVDEQHDEEEEIEAHPLGDEDEPTDDDEDEDGGNDPGTSVIAAGAGDGDEGTEAEGAGGESDDEEEEDDPDYQPPAPRRRKLRRHTAETAGRVGKVVELRLRHGYRRPPGNTVERLLAGEGLTSAETAMRRAIVGWTREVRPAHGEFDYRREPEDEWQPESNAPNDAPMAEWEAGDAEAAGTETLDGPAEGQARRENAYHKALSPRARHRRGRRRGEASETTEADEKNEAARADQGAKAHEAEGTRDGDEHTRRANRDKGERRRQRQKESKRRPGEE